jgi:predicted transcriptional regulator
MSNNCCYAFGASRSSDWPFSRSIFSNFGRVNIWRSFLVGLSKSGFILHSAQSVPAAEEVLLRIKREATKLLRPFRIVPIDTAPRIGLSFRASFRRSAVVTHVPSSIRTLRIRDRTASASITPFKGARLTGCNGFSSFSGLSQGSLAISSRRALKSILVCTLLVIDLISFEGQYYAYSIVHAIAQPLSGATIIPLHRMTARDALVGLFEKGFDKPSDLLCCAFGLRNTEIDAFFSLMSGPRTVKEIALKIGRDRSTIQRILTKLCQKGLVEQEERTFDRGGYYYMYRAVSSIDVRDQILSQLEEWYNQTRRFLLESWPDNSK